MEVGHDIQYQVLAMRFKLTDACIFVLSFP
jgi:hypothetical protein